MCGRLLGHCNLLAKMLIGENQMPPACNEMALPVQRAPEALGAASALAPAHMQPQGGADCSSDTTYMTLHPSLPV